MTTKQLRELAQKANFRFSSPWTQRVHGRMLASIVLKLWLKKRATVDKMEDEKARTSALAASDLALAALLAAGCNASAFRQHLEAEGIIAKQAGSEKSQEVDLDVHF